MYRPELQVCTATRSPCEDQALPLSWAPPSSAEGGKSPQGQPCCRLQWLRLSTFSASGRLTEFFREPRHLQMPAEEQRSGGPALWCARRPDVPPLKRGLGGLRQAGPGICESKYVEDAKAARSVRVWDRVPLKKNRRLGRRKRIFFFSQLSLYFPPNGG